MMFIAICLAFCTINCGALAWSPSPEADVVGYIIRVQGFEVARIIEPYWEFPSLSSETEFNVVAVDAAGQESETARRLLVDPGVAAPFMEVDCAAGSCRQWVCGGMP